MQYNLLFQRLYDYYHNLQTVEESPRREVSEDLSSFNYPHFKVRQKWPLVLKLKL